LRQAFRRETELFFDSILREGRSAIELLTANYTFVNERLAKHYGIPGIRGSHFRRVERGAELDERRGLLGKGSILTTSSQPGRTSPVIRGNGIMTHLIGVPPPPPPPNVPELEASEEALQGSGAAPTLREMLERHRENPACLSCHSLMDPFGFAMEPFDAIGRLRATDNGRPIDAADVMYDGTPVRGPDDIRAFLVKYSDQFLTNLAEKLLTYALGRGVTHHDMPIVRSIVRETAEHDYRLDAMIVEVVKSPAFRMSTKTGQTAAGALTRGGSLAEPTTAAVGSN